jgi:hypothetical protein
MRKTICNEAWELFQKSQDTRSNIGFVVGLLAMGRDRFSIHESDHELL